MNLVKWNPSIEMNTWLDDFFNRSISDIVGSEATYNSPAVNIIEDADQFRLELAAPGMSKSDFKISLEKDHLIISRAAHNETETTDDATKYYRKEFSYQSFKRSFSLPETVDQEGIKANYKNGILSISLAKKDEAIDKGPQNIDIV